MAKQIKQENNTHKAENMHEHKNTNAAHACHAENSGKSECSKSCSASHQSK